MCFYFHLLILNLVYLLQSEHETIDHTSDTSCVVVLDDAKHWCNKLFQVKRNTTSYDYLALQMHYLLLDTSLHVFLIELDIAEVN